MFVDITALDGLRKPATVEEGGLYRNEISKWGYYSVPGAKGGFPYVVKAVKTHRTDDRPLGFTDDMDVALEAILERIEELKKKIRSMSGSDTFMAKWESDSYRLQLEADDLIEKRKELSRWEFREISRCLYGYGTLTGKHYFYFNYGWITDINNSGVVAIRPDYRMADDWIFRAILEVERDHTGIIGGKRRRFGATWISVADDMYDMFFNDATNFFITKDGDDVTKYFARIDHFYSRLPSFMKKKLDKYDTTDGIMYFSKNDKITAVKKHFGIVNKTYEPAMSRLRSGIPKYISSLAGETASKIRVDEIGEIPNIMAVWQIVEPILKGGNSYERAGCFIGMGTVGSMDPNGSGKGFKRMYNGHAALGLRKIMIAGWMGIEPDEFGNSDEAKISAKIRKQIKMYEKEGFISEANTERQKFPLEEEDMFRTDNSKCLMPIQYLEEMTRRRELVDVGQGVIFGVFIRDSKSRVVSFLQQKPNAPKDPANPDMAKHIGYRQWIFVEGECENKIPYIRNSYCAGADPIDLDRDEDTSRSNRTYYERSDITAIIYKRLSEIGGEGEMPVGFYASQSEDLDDEYEQIALACEYFDCCVNIERQKGSRMYSYFKKHGFTQRIAYNVDAASLNKRNNLTWGYAADAPTWQTHITLGKSWIKNHNHKMQFDRLIDELYRVKQSNTDAAVAFLAALHYASELDVRDEVGGQQKNEGTKRLSYAESKQLIQTPRGFVPTQAGSGNARVRNIIQNARQYHRQR